MEDESIRAGESTNEPFHTDDRVELVLPELGMGSVPILVGQWLVEAERGVTEGDRLLEIVAGSATVDLPAPASGVLRETFVGDDERLVVGQVLGVIEATANKDE